MKVKSYIICTCLLLSFLFCEVQKSYGQCGNSDIIASEGSKCLPTLVRFVVTPAFPSGSIYYWDVGNGPVLGSDTFYNQYTSGGSYGVTATIILPNGTKCTITKPNGFLFFNPIPNPGFYADQTKICNVPGIISLHDTTKNIVSRDWYINGVLNTNHAANINITDTSVGYLSITLIVYDNLGCTQSIAKQDYINIPENVPVNFCSVMTENTSHNQISAKFKVGFDTAGYDISEFDWSFPGGNPSSYTGFAPPAITYTNLSTLQNVSLTVKTAGGCIATFTKTNLVGKYYSIANSTLCQKSSALINYLIPSNPGRVTGFYNVVSDIPFHNLSSPSELIAFDGTGVASLKFIILYYQSNCFDTLVVPDMFTILPPLANFTFSPNAVCSIPGIINLHALYGSPGSGTNTYTWQIFDSTSNTQVSGSPIGPISGTDTSFDFKQQGYYSIRLIVANSGGCSDTIIKTDVISVGTPDINYQLIHDTLCVGDTLYVNNLSKWQDAPGNSLKYNWDFYNNDSTYIQVYSTLRSPRVVFTHPGSYDLNYYIESSAFVGSGQGCETAQQRIGAVFVNGISANINISGNNACPPATYSLGATVTGNVPKNSPLKYSWAVQPSTDVTVADPTDSSTNVLFEKQECYNAVLTISNGTCSSVITKDNFICLGTTAAFNMPTSSCRNSPVYPKNASSPRANIFKWSVIPSTGVTINNNSATNPEITFAVPGCYKVILTTSDSSLPNCYDTLSRLICISQPPVVKSMYSPDSASHCAPRVDSFFVKSISGVKFFWDFGDSTYNISNDSELSHLYSKNNNAGYSVKVVAIDSEGCASDTFVQKNYIKISGPEPSFSISSKPPCDSGTVYFTNNSKFVYNYYFLYGDNSVIDSNVIKPHFYTYEDYSKDSNTYRPTMYAYDETGCQASATAIVKLFRPPVLKISSSDTVGCIPFGVQFFDSTKYASKYLWSFGEGGSDTAFAPFYTFSQPSPLGNPFKVTLVATTDKGCADTSKPIYIYSHPLSIPIMSIVVPKILCYQDTVHFQALTSGPVVRYKWKFGDGNLVSDTSSLQNPDYHYVFSGSHRVSLTVFTNYGCSDSVVDSTSIRNLDSFPPIPPEIDFVTVTPDNQIELVFSKSNASKFAYYTVYRFPGPDSIFSTIYVNDTVFYDNPPPINVNGESYTYTIRETDICGFVSPYAIPQHSILLNVNKYKQSALQLIWNKYTGWDSVESYQVYRKNSSGKFVLLATVGVLDSLYLDSNLCPGLYTYYVQAVDQNGIFYSVSDTASDEPDYLYQSTPLVLTKATVVNNSNVSINWSPTVQPNYKYYIVDRYSIDDGWLYNYATGTGLSFLDNGVDVNKYSYTYNVSVIDNCGDVSSTSNIGTSILLTGSVINDSRLLTWNSYKQWASGVSTYHLQIIQNDGSFKDIVVLPSTDTTYMDAASHPDLDVPTCYRVYAVENIDINGNTDTSLSNIACPNLPARIFIPNAFSPNADSLNDVFIPVGISLITNSDVPGQKYDFRVYNRWGELIFETSDFRQGWDGKYEGTPVPIGVYIYSVDAQGFNGQRFYLNGNVTVLR